jgi:hypothetical protein
MEDWYFLLYYSFVSIENLGFGNSTYSMVLKLCSHDLFLHLQFLLGFLMRFSSFDACKRVDEVWIDEYVDPHVNTQ